MFQDLTRYLLSLPTLLAIILHYVIRLPPTILSVIRLPPTNNVFIFVGIATLKDAFN